LTYVIRPESIRITALTRRYAEDIATWRYEPPYEVYDMADVSPDDLLDPASGYFAVLADDRLVGFRSFGTNGQVPGWSYDDSALDTGGGLRPELTGQGSGRMVIAAGLAFGRQKFEPRAFRVSVASFNSRAMATVRALGFEPIGTFHAARDGRDFTVLVRPEEAAGG
jgi:RimJ/RimL family protein N-acetyltransferase